MKVEQEETTNKPVLIPDSQKIPTTLQGFFDIAWKWANRENFQLCFAGGLCEYRNQDNTNACLIGACFPDILYDEKYMRSKTVSDDYFKFLWEEAGIVLHHLDQLQQCHDGAESEGECIENLVKFAEEHQLQISK